MGDFFSISRTKIILEILFSIIDSCFWLYYLSTPSYQIHLRN